MFSSFAQFLPSALQGTPTVSSTTEDAAEELPPQSNFDPTTDDEGDEDELIAQASRDQQRHLENDADGDKRKLKSRKEKDPSKSASETFIFVRPPPSKSNHPLNLQVQLVPPNARAPSGVVDAPTTPTSASSFGTINTDGGRSTTSVARSASTRSSRSEYSTTHSTNSTTSFSSVASDTSGTSSAASSSSGRNPRRIIPLYNLQAHNVLTNTIVDAGTDAKIAKFQKRGLELIDLAILEPVEVWGVRHKEAKREGMKIGVDDFGALVHNNGSQKVNAASTKGNNTLLQPSGQKRENGSRPATPSASSSALSLASQPTHVSNVQNNKSKPYVRVSPPYDSLASPASAPPLSGAFPSSQLPPALKNSRTPTPLQALGPVGSPPINLPGQSHPPKVSTEVSPTSTTPTNTKRTATLFGKLKFNTKRNSPVNSTSPSSITSPAESDDQSQVLTEFGMAPLTPGDLNHRSAVHVTPATPDKAAHPLSPTSLKSFGSQGSNTPTATPISASYGRGDDSPISPAQTISPPRQATSEQSGSHPPANAGHARNTSLTSAISRGKYRFMSGIKGNNAPNPPEMEASPTIIPNGPSPSAQPFGARGFFGKIAAGISGNSNGNAAAEAERNVNPSPRPSFDSNNNSRAGIKSTFDRILNHSNSQQFIGNRDSMSNRTSSESLRQRSTSPPLYAPQSRPLSQLLHQPVIPPPQVSSPSSQIQAPGQANLPPGNHVTLRQLQLRPPVLGIQPTYVSASNPPSTSYHSQQASMVSLASTSGLPQKQEDYTTAFLREVGSRSTLADDSTTGSKKRSGSRSRETDTSARTSLNLERDGGPAAGSSLNVSAVNLAPNPKEKALMYVWLVRKWLKKRGVSGQNDSPPPTVPESKGGGLFSSLVGGRDRERKASDSAAGQRGSWHAGDGSGFMPSLTALTSRSQQASSSTGYGGQLGDQRGQPFVLGSVVGGGIEVRFEWKRAKGKRDKRKKDKKKGEVKERDMAKEQMEGDAKGSSQPGEEDNTPRPRHSSTVGGDVCDSPQRISRSDRKRAHRQSNASINTLSRDVSPIRGTESPSRRNTNSSSASSKKRVSLLLKGKEGEEDDVEKDQDDGEESDAEDSETPWVCTLKIRRVAPGYGVSAGDGSGFLSPPATGPSASSENLDSGEPAIRIKVATLSQTPHHPKVVAMLKVPFPLPDVDVERLEILPRKGYGFGSHSTNDRDQYRGLILTAEEIKDVVCSTGLWVAVRQGFGGVGKVNRKGDGWKIRG
ncbi:hypothetical protein FA15DRAFT_632653 [Coprinopsis marcescibilis]|uniref:Uncharacterized protein n=1 Tax=Coprinopsis marcescibilis TaxID=230819 RepID=A0A5C3LKF5_COPMA|nr:hypothetical protein FA15DRAFT_632653 [Coprinopsis marcescibilis]